MDSEQLTHDKIQAEITHLFAQTAKLNKETRWYEVALLFGAGSAFTLAIVAIMKYFS
jgi:hypothetical protein